MFILPASFLRRRPQKNGARMYQAFNSIDRLRPQSICRQPSMAFCDLSSFLCLLRLFLSVLRFLIQCRTLLRVVGVISRTRAITVKAYCVEILVPIVNKKRKPPYQERLSALFCGLNGVANIVNRAFDSIKRHFCALFGCCSGYHHFD